MGQNRAGVQKKSELRSKALAANRNELPHLEVPLGKLDVLMGQAKDLTAQQASLTASKQEVSKRLTAVLREVQFLNTFLDAGIREHYGNRSEKLVEFGISPSAASRASGWSGPTASR